MAQVDTLTPGGTIEADDLFIVTINSKTVSVSAGGTTATAVCTALYAALSASTIPEFTEITWTNNTTTITGTAKTAGKPHTMTFTTTEAGGGAADAQTATLTATTASSGPNDLNIAVNWTGGVLPANGDDVIFENSSVDALYNLSALSAVTLTSLTIKGSYTGKIGLPEYNAAGYQEYRATYLVIGATTQTIGEGIGNGSGRLKISNAAVQTTLTIRGTATSVESGVEAIQWKGTHASNVVNITKGSLGVAIYAGETAAIATLRIGYTTNIQGDTAVRCGSGTTLTTIEKSGGTLEINSAATTLNNFDGVTTVVGSGAITTVNIDGGTVYEKGTGTITALNVGDGGKFDHSQDMRAVTVTTTILYPGAALSDPYRTIVFTNGVNIRRGALADVTLDVGTNINLVIAASA